MKKILKNLLDFLRPLELSVSEKEILEKCKTSNENILKFLDAELLSDSNKSSEHSKE